MLRSDLQMTQGDLVDLEGKKISTRSQLRRSTMRQVNDKIDAWEGQNRELRKNMSSD